MHAHYANRPSSLALTFAGAGVSVLAGVATLLVPMARTVAAQEPMVATRTPAREAATRTLRPDSARWLELDRTIAPAVARARSTYPEARDRFNAGLPRGHALFVTIRLTDHTGRIEQVALFVDRIADGRIEGRVASHITWVDGYELRQEHVIAEEEIYDWRITRPDGSEEGNFMGSLLGSRPE